MCGFSFFSSFFSSLQTGESFAACADGIMMAHALDTVAVTKCMEDSWVSPEGKDSLDKLPNALLKQEISDAKDYGVLKLPEAVVNGVVLRGQTGYGATLELNVAQAICNGRLRVCSFFHIHHRTS